MDMNTHTHAHTHYISDANNRAVLNVPLTGYHIHSPLPDWISEGGGQVVYCPPQGLELTVLEAQPVHTCSRYMPR